MNRLTQTIFEIAPSGCFTSRDAAVLFPESQDQRYGLVKRAIVGGEILHIRRGLYCLAPKYRKTGINPYALAQHIHGPSYVSLESALSWHGWIPEAVYTITNVAAGKSKEFRTPLGLFSYSRVLQQVLYAGVERYRDDTGNVFLMATPMKALADYVYVHRENWTGPEPAVESLRIEPEAFESVSPEEVAELIDNYAGRRVRKFLEGVLRELKR